MNEERMPENYGICSFAYFFSKMFLHEIDCSTAGMNNMGCVCLFVSQIIAFISRLFSHSSTHILFCKKRKNKFHKNIGI